MLALVGVWLEEHYLTSLQTSDAKSAQLLDTVR